MRLSVQPDETSLKIRELAVRLLVLVDRSKTLIRQPIDVGADDPGADQSVLYLARRLVFQSTKYLNTIDFIISRSGGLRQYSSDPVALAALRLAVFERVWLGSPSRSLIKLYGLSRSSSSVVYRAAHVKLESATAAMNHYERLSVLYSHPSFIIETLAPYMDRESLLALLRANNHKRRFYLRSNRIRDPDSSSIEAIRQMGAELVPDPDVPGLFLVKRNIRAVTESQLTRDGRLFVQDKGSVMATGALDVEPGDTVWDACAAPGMKTELLWERMGGVGKIVASDSSTPRIRSSRPRLTAAGCDIVTWINADASRCPVRDADKILIDAPCTSTGTLRSRPYFKWRLSKKTLVSLMVIQNKILDGIVSMYSDRPGTEIVYITCSLLPHEGESQIDSLMTRHEIELLDIDVKGSPGYPGFRCSEKAKRFFPHIHDTDGFFVCRFRTT